MIFFILHQKKVFTKHHHSLQKMELSNIEQPETTELSNMVPPVVEPITISTDMATTTNRKEVQAHGFIWENEILKHVFHATEEELSSRKYTDKMDLDASLNRLDNCNLSIKTSKSLNSVGMADCLRLYDIVDSGIPIHMIVIHYVQDPINKTKSVLNITEVDLTSSRELLFGHLNRSHIEELDKEVKCIPQKRKPSPEESAKLCSLRDSLKPLAGYIYLNIKCNSTQSRLQCSFTNFQQFIKDNPERVIAQSNTNEFRGGTISACIKSAQREFKKKVSVIEP